MATSQKRLFSTTYQVRDSEGRIWAQSSDPDEIRRMGQELEAQAQPYEHEGAGERIDYGDHHGPVRYEKLVLWLVDNGWELWEHPYSTRAREAVTPDEQ
jgi:hypothetical protein